mmetsp:Transcript_25548/g.66026  ORF Transcript_25548/g.66026 Transcript_25548/m.66026 type:complete len:341 (-) Transcript_25548:31-1053(-)
MRVLGVDVDLLGLEHELDHLAVAAEARFVQHGPAVERLQRQVRTLRDEPVEHVGMRVLGRVVRSGLPALVWVVHLGAALLELDCHHHGVRAADARDLVKRGLALVVADVRLHAGEEQLVDELPLADCARVEQLKLRLRRMPPHVRRVPVQWKRHLRRERESSRRLCALENRELGTLACLLRLALYLELLRAPALAILDAGRLLLHVRRDRFEAHEFEELLIAHVVCLNHFAQLPVRLERESEVDGELVERDRLGVILVDLLECSHHLLVLLEGVHLEVDLLELVEGYDAIVVRVDSRHYVLERLVEALCVHSVCVLVRSPTWPGQVRTPGRAACLQAESW